jgi:hypothetical protein
MPSLKPSQDVQPLSAIRANAAGFLEQVRETERPLVLTQQGKDWCGDSSLPGPLYS